MSHPLRAAEIICPASLGFLRACVRVRHERRSPGGSVLLLDPGDEGGICILREDAVVVELPQRLPVLYERKRIRPSKGAKFVITVESFDPYHLVAEVPA